MRVPDWVRRRLGRGREAAPEALGLVEVLRAAVVGDDENLERLAAVRARDRAGRERERAEREEQQAQRDRYETAARALRRRVERYGSWFPGDPL